MIQTDTPSKSITFLFWVSSALFLGSLTQAPSLLTVLLKITPILCLIVLVCRTEGDWRKYIILAALLCSAGGDISLELNNFTLGLSCFFLAHFFYILIFFNHIAPTPARSMLALTIITSTIFLGIFLTPHLGELTLPVYAYMAIITIMGVGASLGSKHHPAIIIGALIFIVSDSLIALNRFYEPIPGARYAIMSTYYLAQFLLTTDARKGNYSTKNS